MVREHYRKKSGDRLRCKACGVAFEYHRGREASESLALHIRLNKDCNKYYNEEAADEHQRLYWRDGKQTDL